MKTDYILLLALGFVAGCLYVLRTFDLEKSESKYHKIRHIISGVGSSMLITYITFELLVYQGLPSGTSVALSAGVGYLGAESVSKFITMFLEKKIK